MARKATGTVYEKRGDLFVSITVATGPKGRHSAKLATRDPIAAEARKEAIAEAVVALRRARVERKTIEMLVADMAAASDARMAGLQTIVAELAAANAPPTDEKILTFGDIAGKWTSGELHRDFPKHVKDVDHAENKLRLNKHVLPFVRDVPITMFALEHAERVLRQPTLPSGSQRHVAQLMTRICNLAVYPVKAIKQSPIPRGWLPHPNPPKAGEFLYPDEDATLLACTAVALELRMLVGFMDREGTRRSEAANLEWSDLDLERGAVNLDVNKTDDPRAWALDPGVLAALKWWHEQRKELGPYVFGGAEPPNVEHLADQLRAALKRAGVTRPSLFESSASRQRLRAHDLRATFITLSLANGKSESWVADRTGHKSSQMINRYRRRARMVAELGIGTLTPLVDAIPETSTIVGRLEGSNESGRKAGATGGTRTPMPVKALEPKPNRAPGEITETHGSKASLTALRAKWPPFGDAVDASPTIRRLRRTRLGRALDDAVRAAMGGDERAIRRTMYRLGRLHGGVGEGAS